MLDKYRFVYQKMSTQLTNVCWIFNLLLVASVEIRVNENFLRPPAKSIFTALYCNEINRESINRSYRVTNAETQTSHAKVNLIVISLILFLFDFWYDSMYVLRFIESWAIVKRIETNNMYIYIFVFNWLLVRQISNVSMYNFANELFNSFQWRFFFANFRRTQKWEWVDFLLV